MAEAAVTAHMADASPSRRTRSRADLQVIDLWTFANQLSNKLLTKLPGIKKLLSKKTWKGFVGRVAMVELSEADSFTRASYVVARISGYHSKKRQFVLQIMTKSGEKDGKAMCESHDDVVLLPAVGTKVSEYVVNSYLLATSQVQLELEQSHVQPVAKRARDEGTTSASKKNKVSPVADASSASATGDIKRVRGRGRGRGKSKTAKKTMDRTSSLSSLEDAVEGPSTAFTLDRVLRAFGNPRGCMHAYALIYAHSYMRTHICTHIYEHSYMVTHICSLIYVHSYMYTHICVLIYAHSYMRTHICAHKCVVLRTQIHYSLPR
jgi:hypothetical protein